MIKIYGKNGCKFCKKAKQLAEDQDLTFEYIDIVEQGITKLDLGGIAGQEVSTVPVIMVEGIYLGGFKEFKDEYDKGSNQE